MKILPKPKATYFDPLWDKFDQWVLTEPPNIQLLIREYRIDRTNQTDYDSFFSNIIADNQQMVQPQIREYQDRIYETQTNIENERRDILSLEGRILAKRQQIVADEEYLDILKENHIRLIERLKDNTEQNTLYYIRQKLQEFGIILPQKVNKGGVIL